MDYKSIYSIHSDYKSEWTESEWTETEWTPAYPVNKNLFWQTINKPNAYKNKPSILMLFFFGKLSY